MTFVVKNKLFITSMTNEMNFFNNNEKESNFVVIVERRINSTIIIIISMFVVIVFKMLFENESKLMFVLIFRNLIIFELIFFVVFN